MDLLSINRMDHCWVYRKLHDMNENMYKLAIEAINNLIAADEVEDDLYADALMVKQFMMDTAAQIPLPVPFNEGVVPVMETTIEGAQRRIASVIDNPNLALYGSRVDLEYIGVFLDSVGDEMAAMTSAYNSLHERYVQALAAIDQWEADFNTVNAEAQRHMDEKIELRKEIDRIRRANLNNLHAANDNR